jgi:SNF2 family DNA or RNA helicase
MLIRQPPRLEIPVNVAEVRAELQTFIDKHVRQNKSNLVESICVCEHDELVDLTPEERLLYRQACHDLGIFDLEQGYQDISMEKRAILLQWCAHFDLHAEAGSAGDAVRHLGGAKRERIKMAENQLRIEVSRAALFGMLPDAHDALVKIQYEKVKQFITALVSLSASLLEKECVDGNLKVKVEFQNDRGDIKWRPEVRLVQPIRELEYLGEAHRHAWVHAVANASKMLDYANVCHHFACKGAPTIATMLAAVLGAAGVLEAAHRSLEFYEKQLHIVSGGVAAGEEECPICLDDLADVRTLGILPCAHVFHTACIREIVQKRRECPTCRRSCDVRQISSMVVELLPQPAPLLPLAGWLAGWPTKLQAHGSKLNAIAERLTQIHIEDPSAKVIVFMQWATLEAKVALALSAHGHKFVTLKRHGSCTNNGRLLKEFQDSTAESDPWILLLSLESASSGTNLTAASHILFVHPMNAQTVARAAAHEKQALGRVQRVGQKRKEVHVWRFITRETVESHIWNSHRTAIESIEESVGMSDERDIDETE